MKKYCTYSLNLFNKASGFKFVTRKKNIFNDQSNANLNTDLEIIYYTDVLKSNLVITRMLTF